MQPPSQSINGEQTKSHTSLYVEDPGHDSKQSNPTVASLSLAGPPPTQTFEKKKTDSAAAAYHPEFMFCGSCTTCSPAPVSGTNGSATGQPTPQMMSMLTKVPMQRKKKGTAMKFVRAGDINVIDDDQEMSIDSDIENGADAATPLAIKEKETAQLYISNLSTDSQMLLLESVMDASSGVSEVKNYLHDNNERKSKTVDVTYDPLGTSLDGMVESLQNLGLDASIIRQSNSNNHIRETIPKRKTCRSSLHAEGICCASEVPEVTSILRKLGVEKVSINITARMVYVDHFSEEISAADLVSALNYEGFGATIKKDGGIVGRKKKKKSDNAGQGTAEPSPSFAETSSSVSAQFVESTLMCPSFVVEEESDLIKDILEDENLLYSKVRYVSLPNLASRTMKIEHNPKLVSAQNLADILMDSGGYTNVIVLLDGQKEGTFLPDTVGVQDLDYVKWGHDRRCRQIRSFLPKGLGLNIVLSGVFWIVSLVGHFNERLSYLKYAGLLSVFFGIPSVALKAYRTLKRRHFDANCMMVTAAFGAMFLQEFDEAASVSFLFSISEFLEDQATRKARLALDSIVNMRPDRANLIHPSTGDIDIVPVSDLEIDSLVCVRTGDQIPSDGIVVEGSSQVDESSLTGESALITKEAGDTVSGGTINAGNTRLVIRTTVLVEDSAVSRLIKLVEESASNRSPTEQVVDAFAKSYTPTVICIAMLMCTIPWFFGVEEGRRWTLNSLIIVVIACPCALTISTPVTYAAGLAATAQKGIIVKGGARLEALGSVKTIVFDKTGTLTQGSFTLNHLVTVGSQKTRREVLALLSIMEAPSSHPLAATLVNAAKAEGVGRSIGTTVVDHSILKGEGVTAIVDGDEVYVGNIKLFKRLGLYDDLDDEQKEKAMEWNEEGGTIGFLGIKGIGIVGMFCVADSVRPEARSVVTTLISDGFNVMMLTGDGDGAANAIAKKVGLPDESVRSQFLPEDKLHFVSSMLGLSKRKGNLFSKKELLLFVGDGVNDAPALAVADIGVAMGAGAALAMEMSDVTLMDSNLSKLLFSLNMGTKVVMTVQENILFSVVVKLIVIALTFAGRMTLLGAITADVGVMLLVSINGMKLLPGSPRICCGQRRHYNKLPIAPRHPYTVEGEIV